MNEKRLPTRLSKLIADKFRVENNTLVRDVKTDPKDRIHVEIGDSKQKDFKPQAKISRWDNEVNFSLRAIEHPHAVVQTEGKIIKYKTPEYEVHLYEIDPGEIGEDGGLEFEWILPRKPSTNVLQATIQTKGLNFYYQPALTPEEIAEGTFRPENVEGSYAVYHATKGRVNRADGMEYKAGKAFHIYRPKITDANGNKTWGELNIDEQDGLLSVTIPQKFLDEAVYPVIVDPTFGYTSIGATESNPGSNPQWRGRIGSPSSDGLVQSIFVAAKSDDSNTASIKGTLVYSNKVIHTNGVGSGVDFTSSTAAFRESVFSTEALVIGGHTYYAGFVFLDTADGGRVFQDSGGVSGDSIFDNSNDYTTPTNPTDANVSTNIYSVYAEYTDVATKKQVFVGGVATTLSTTENNYWSIHGHNSSETAATNNTWRKSLFPKAGIISKLKVKLSAAPGAGKSYTFNLLNNTSELQNSSLTISETATEVELDTDGLVSLGDLIQLRSSPVGGPNAASALWSTEFTSIDTDDSITSPAGTGAVPTNDGASYYNNAFSGGTYNTTEGNRQNVMPHAGVITEFHVSESGTPGTSNTWTIWIIKNGSRLSASEIVFSGTDTGLKSVTGLSESFVAGDTLSIEITDSGTVANGNQFFYWGIVYQPTTSDEWAVAGSSGNALDPTTTEYNRINATGALNWNSDESIVRRLSYSFGDYYLKQFRVLLSAAPGAGKSYTFTLMKNGSEALNEVVISGSDTTGFDNVNVDTIAPDDELSIKCVPSGTPDVVFAKWSFIASYTAPPSSEFFGNRMMMGIGL